MSCGTCATNKNGVPNGCKSNGNCATGSCGSKLNVFDWLSNMTLPTGEEEFNICEIRFKNGRKQFYKNNGKISLSIGDTVVVSCSQGYDVGVVSLRGELVKVQMKKKKVSQKDDELEQILRKASQKDIDTWHNVREKEPITQQKSRLIISNLRIKMKLSDVEYQGDGKKATFYYTADDRVDFRELVRSLARTFSIRIEMKQVGVRQEAARVGGIGSCGRELCCSSWFTDFRKVNTSAARYQQLSLNTSKLSGQCGKLKCCLNFELDTYLDILKIFPKQELILKTKKGDAIFIKKDIFKKLLWYSYANERSKWYKLTLDQVTEIIKLNQAKKTSLPLENYESELEFDDDINFEDAVGEDSISRFDNKKQNSNRNKNRNRKFRSKKQNSNSNTNATKQNDNYNIKTFNKNNKSEKVKNKNV